jgi:DNA-binding response OmpR family regulator
MKVLLVEADERSLSTLKTELNRQKFLVDGASDGETAWGLAQSFAYDLILLNAALPKLDGISLCRRLRSTGNLVLVMLMVEASDRSAMIQGLDSGADDCVTKPIDQPELFARMRALARRGLRKAAATVSWGPVSLNPISRQITCNGQIVAMGRKEYQILELLLRSPRQVFTRSEITDLLWSLDEQIPMEATIKTHIHGIRRKLEQAGAADFIQTQYGYGYCLNPLFAKTPELTTSANQDIDPVVANTWHELMAANAQLHQEIEERHRVETQLCRSEMLLRNAQKVAQIGSWEFDFATLETYWTAELYLIHGLDPTKPAPTHEQIRNLIHPDDREIHETAVVQPATRGEFFDVNLRIIRQDGEIRYINARGGPVFDQTGKMIKLTGTTFDITDWQYPEIALQRKANEQRLLKN